MLLPSRMGLILFNMTREFNSFSNVEKKVEKLELVQEVSAEEVARLIVTYASMFTIRSTLTS